MCIYRGLVLCVEILVHFIQCFDVMLLQLQEEIFVARAPGRLDVMGGIADYSGSMVLQVWPAYHIHTEVMTLSLDVYMLIIGYNSL